MDLRTFFIFEKHISFSNKQTENSLFLIVLTLECLAFYKLGNFNQTLPIWNDNINITLPNRVYLDNALSSGTYPFFDFLSGSGIPFLSIYTSSGLSPLTILLALIFKYSTHIFLVEIFFLNVIAFTGMYFWIKKISNSTIALIGSSAFVLSTSVIGQSRANIEAVGTTAALPWIFLGLINISKSKKVGAFQMAGGLGLAFTHGYLGLNLLIAVLTIFGIGFFGISYLLGEFYKGSKIQLRDFKIPFKLFIVGSLLFAGTVFPLLTESFQNFSKYMYLDREISPFTASMRFDSWTTIFDPLNVRGQMPDEYGGFFANLFIPAPVLIGLVGMFFSKKIILIPATLLILLSYLSLLPENYAVTRFLVNLLPGFDSIRFHSWAAIFIVFLLLTFGSIGLNNFESNSANINNFYWIAIGLTILFVLQVLTAVTAKYLIISIIFTLLSVLCIFMITRLEKESKYKKLIFTSLLITIVFLQMSFADKRIGADVSPYSKNDQNTIVELAISGQSSWPIENVQRKGLFSILGQYPHELIGNQHLFVNQPVNISYTPQINKKVYDANTGRGLPTLEPFIVDSNFNSLDYSASFPNPNELSLQLNSRYVGFSNIQISHSKNFVLLVNGEKRNFEKTDENFIGLKLNVDDEQIRLIYQPKMGSYQLALSALAWMSIFAGVIKSRQNLRKVP